MSRHRSEATGVGSVRCEIGWHGPAFRRRDFDLLARHDVDNEVTRRQDFHGLDGLSISVVVVDMDFARDLLLNGLLLVVLDNFVRHDWLHNLVDLGLFGLARPEARWKGEIFIDRWLYSCGSISLINRVGTEHVRPCC